MNASIEYVLLKSNRKWILIACMLAMFMAAVEVTIVATAMPNVITDLNGFHLLGWVFSIYLLIQAVTIPIYGKLADLYGRKSVLFFGTGVFLIGSILCGFSKSMAMLIFFRALQGFGAGAIVPLSTTIIADVYNQQDRTRIHSYLSSVWGISAIIGPLIGAFIVEHFCWSGVFWINVPIGILSIVLLARFLPNKKSVYIVSSLDIISIIYLTITISSLLITLLQIQISMIWKLWLIGLSVISSIMLIREQKRSSKPLFPLTFWNNRVIIASNIGGLIIGAAMMSIATFLPTYVQAVMRGNVLESGWTLSVMSIGWPIASVLSGQIMTCTSYRFTAIFGAVLLFIGSLMFLQLNIDSSILYAGCSAFVIGLGMGMSNTTFLISVQNEVSYEIRGIATASTIFSRMLGSAIGTAVLSYILNINLGWRLPQEQNPIQILIDQSGQRSINTVFLAKQIVSSMHLICYISALMALCAIASSYLIPAKIKPKIE